MTRKSAAKAKANREAVEQAIAVNPNATQEQIAEQVGLNSQGYVSEIIAELSANQHPKLRKHGGKREKQADNNKDAPKKFGTDPAYIKARLARDKADEDQPAEVREKAAFLLAGIERGEVKPHGAAKAMGYVKPLDPAAIVEKQRQQLPDCGIDGPNPNARYGAWVSANFAETGNDNTLLNARRLWEVFGEQREIRPRRHIWGRDHR